MIGETASHYRVLERLGAGGMGDVYLAQDTRLHRPVALKMLKPEVYRDEAARARLLREARAASALNHPNIATIYEVDELALDEGPVRFIAMEYVAGRTLAELSRSGDLPLDEVLDIAGQVAGALVEAHARGIVHRDVKPSNVMVTDSGRVKVLDFGLAKRDIVPYDPSTTWSREPRSMEGALVGTLAYMAPEQALGQEVDGRADVFSLGAVLYEALAGQSPFPGRNAVQVLDAILHKEPPPLPARPDPRWAGVELVLRRMLAKDRDRRYPSMRAAAVELEAVRRGGSPEVVPLDVPLAHAVAVLGFANITSNGEDDWLGTGIAETVTADLRGVQGLTVIGRERVRETLQRLGLADDRVHDSRVVQVGRAVGARFVLEGGFQRAGDSVRVTARLTEAEGGSIVHTVKIDGRLPEIFDLQDRIVRELSAALRGPAPRELEDTRVVEAFEAYSKGVINLRRETYESLDRAAVFFERAVRLDPGYVKAHRELGSAYASKADFMAVPELHERALASFRRALELRPGMVRVWREMGGSLIALGRDDEGIEAIRRALELDPEDAGALAAMGRAQFVGLGRFADAVPWFDKALARNPQGGWYALQLSHVLALLGQFERGEVMARRAVELQAGFLSGQEGMLIVGAHMRLGHLAALQGRHEEAAEEFRRELGFIQRVDHALRSRIVIELNMRLGAAYRRFGRTSEAEAAFRTALQSFEERIRLGADEPFTRYYVACVHAHLGALDDAVDCLEKAARVRRRFTVARARVEPELEALRGHPRFEALLRQD